MAQVRPADAQELLERLQTVTAALAGVTSLARCADVVLTQGLEALGGDAGMLMLLDPERQVLELVESRGYPEQALDGWRTIPLEAPILLAETARTGAPIFLGTREETVQRYPAITDALKHTHNGARVSLPLVLEGRVLGTLGVSWAQERTFDEEDRAFILAVASQGALALERAQLYERERTAREEALMLAARLKVLAEASRAFAAEQQDLRGVLQTVAGQLTGTLADGCILHLLSPDGDVLVPEVVAHVDPEAVQPLWEALVQAPIPAGAGRLGVALRSGGSVLVPQAHGGPWWSAEEPAHLELHARFPLHSLLVVPLRMGSRVLGAFTLTRHRPAQPFTREDQQLAEDVADRATLAIDNAYAYSREREARAHAEAAARRAARLTEEARRAVQVRDEFLSVASHELKTPLTPLSLRAQALARELAAGSTRGAAVHVEVMQRQVRKLADLVEGLLDVSRVGEGRLSLARELVCLVDLVREVVARHEQEAQKAGCALELSLPEEAVGQWDRLRLEQVVVNLLTNALKYGAGGPVRLAVESDTGVARLVVQDAGIGIDPRDVPRIFERFERAVSSRNYGGMGLGLYISRQLVEALGGTIRVDSRPGAGARFTVELPRN